MFVKAIETNSRWTYPITICFKDKTKEELDLCVATIIKVNNEGCFLTCRHVAEMLNNHFILANNQKITNKNIISSSLIFPIKIKENTKIDIIIDNSLDLAVIKINNLNLTGELPKFSNNIPKPGMSICKLGFAFNNGNPFEYDKNKKIIKYNQNKLYETPLFPYDGIVTRNINISLDNKLYENAAFETSSAGLRGQSGGPIFNKDGLIYGIQSMNVTIPLNYSIPEENKFHEQYINFGIGVSSKEIIKFLNANNIKYNY